MIPRSVIGIPISVGKLAKNIARKVTEITESPVTIHRYASQPVRNSGRSNQSRYLSTKTLTESNQKPKIIEDHGKGSIKVTWDDGIESEYANIFLRDQCKCSLCYNANSNSRLLEPYTLNLDVLPNRTVISGDTLSVSWSDGHQSSYPFEFLKNVQTGLDDDVRYLDPILWKSEHFQRNYFPTYSMSEIIGDEGLMLEWFTNLKRVGVTVLTGGGAEPGALDTIKEKLFGGYFKSTHYG